MWLVSTGEYSDYHVIGVFSTRKKAALAQKLHNASFLEEEVLDKIPEHPPGLLPWSVDMDVDGNTHKVDRESVEYVKTNEWEPYGDGVHVVFNMWAKDEEHAVKIANERRVKLIASNQWTTDFDEWANLRAGLLPKL